MSIHSSWNCDRMATCCNYKKTSCHKIHKPYYIAQYKDNVVSILGSRGGLHHSWTLSSKISSAIIHDGILAVETEDGSKMTYDVETYKTLSFVGTAQKPSSIPQAADCAA